MISQRISRPISMSIGQALSKKPTGVSSGSESDNQLTLDGEELTLDGEALTFTEEQ